jgi:hypothetical protein
MIFARIASYDGGIAKRAAPIGAKYLTIKGILQISQLNLIEFQITHTLIFYLTSLLSTIKKDLPQINQGLNIQKYFIKTRIFFLALFFSK